MGNNAAKQAAKLYASCIPATDAEGLVGTVRPPWQLSLADGEPYDSLFVCWHIANRAEELLAYGLSLPAGATLPATKTLSLIYELRIPLHRRSALWTQPAEHLREGLDPAKRPYSGPVLAFVPRAVFASQVRYSFACWCRCASSLLRTRLLPDVIPVAPGSHHSLAPAMPRSLTLPAATPQKCSILLVVVCAQNRYFPDTLSLDIHPAMRGAAPEGLNTWSGEFLRQVRALPVHLCVMLAWRLFWKLPRVSRLCTAWPAAAC